MTALWLILAAEKGKTDHMLVRVLQRIRENIEIQEQINNDICIYICESEWEERMAKRRETED